MKCAWDGLLAVLPVWLRRDVDRLGREELQELRLRLGKPPELILSGKSLWLEQIARQDDLNFCINTASQYSPWAAQSISQGYLTAQGGAPHWYLRGGCAPEWNGAGDTKTGVSLYSCCPGFYGDRSGTGKDVGEYSAPGSSGIR